MLEAETAEARARRVHTAEVFAYAVEDRKRTPAASEADEQRVREWREAHRRLDNVFILATACSFVAERVKRILQNFDGSDPHYAYYLSPDVGPFRDALYKLDNDFDRLSLIAPVHERFVAMLETFYASLIMPPEHPLVPGDDSYEIMVHLDRDFITFHQSVGATLDSARKTARYFGWEDPLA